MCSRSCRVLGLAVSRVGGFGGFVVVVFGSVIGLVFAPGVVLIAVLVLRLGIVLSLVFGLVRRLVLGPSNALAHSKMHRDGVLTLSGDIPRSIT